ncbi:MAG TPA: FAD:protein FMN transferase [Firmicutes bacterium]|nr:FAD:protein FMN transferase [Bacillota bacterium]
MAASARSRRVILALVAAAVVFGLVAGGYFFFYLPYVKAQESQAQATRFLMDTSVDISAFGRDAETYVKQAFGEMERLEEVLSRHIVHSEVAKINSSAGEWVSVSEPTIEVISLGLEIGELTKGAFDITVGVLVSLWGFGTGDYKVPSSEEIAEALATIDYRKVEVDKAGKRVRIPEGSVLDLGGIAKGYIVDQARSYLVKHRMQRAIVNAGGDISVIGARPDGTPWRVGVQNPNDPSQISWVIPLQNNSVVTSGDYQRFFIQDGARWHHILDPRTGYPARELKSVTIVAQSAARADALSTAVFVLGWEKGKELVEKLPGVEGILVGSDNQVWISSGLAESAVTL